MRTRACVNDVYDTALSSVHDNQRRDRYRWYARNRAQAEEQFN